MKSTTLAVSTLAASTLFLTSMLGDDRDGATCGADPTAVMPKSSYGTAFTSAYPGSFSLSNVQTGTGKTCQLCHESSSGGDGYNAYGWALKIEIDGGSSTAAALATVEASDSDGDGDSNIDEINASTQPGWTPGNNNTIFFDGGGTTLNQPPPGGILGALDRVSYPTVVHNGTGANPLVLADIGGSPAISPRLNDPTEPFRLSLDCSNALAPGIRTIVVRPQLLGTPISTSLGELLIKGPVLQKFPGVHNQNVVNTPNLVLPFKLNFLGLRVYAQGFCGNGPGLGGFLSNAIEHRVGI